MEIKYKKIKSESGVTILGGIAWHKGKLYTLKTNHTDTISTISSDNWSKRYTGKFDHGNGICASNDALYIATLSKHVERVDFRGFNRTSIDTNYKVSGIAYYKDNKFIVRSGKNYYLTDSKFHVVARIPFPQLPEGFTVQQDIDYYEGNIYNVVSSENKCSNVIVISSMIDGHIVDILRSKVKNSLYEFESCCHSSDGTLYIGTNTVKGDYIMIWK